MCTCIRWFIMGINLLLLNPAMSYGQIATNFYEPEEAVNFTNIHPSKSYKTITIQHGSFEDRMQEDEKRLQQGNPFRYGQPLSTTISLKDGRWINFKDKKIWQVMVTSKDAYTLGVMFSRLQLAPKAELFVYNPTQTIVVGPINNENLHRNQLNTDFVEDDSVIIELIEPKDTKMPSTLYVNNIMHGYRDPNKLIGQGGLAPITNPAELDTINGVQLSDVVTNAIGDALACNIDAETFNGWDSQNSGVAIILYPNGNICSGCLVNNTDQNRRSFFLTAEHCDSNIENANFRFHFLTAVPGSNLPRPTLTYTGSVVRARHIDSDYLLIELNNNVAHSSYLGWDSQNTNPPTGAVYLHHPRGDLMKLTIGHDDPQLITNTIGDFWYQRPSSGGLEPGSSGGPVMKGANQNRLIFGVISGGDLPGGGCGRDVEARIGSFFHAWPQFDNWLSPGNTARRELATLHVRPAAPSLTGFIYGSTANISANSSFNSRQYDWEVRRSGIPFTIYTQTTAANSTSISMIQFGYGTYEFRSRGRNDGSGTGNWSNWITLTYGPGSPFSFTVQEQPSVLKTVVYPNPANDWIAVDGNILKEEYSSANNNIQIISIELYDELGDLVIRTSPVDNRAHIITDHYKSGIYILHIHHTEGIVKERIIIDR